MLSDTAIKTAKAKDKPYKLYDEKGMFVLITPTGSKYFRLKYRFENKEKNLALGAYPETSLKNAREKRDEARIQIISGIDPSQSKKETKQLAVEKQQNTFKLVFFRWLSVNQSWGDKYREDVAARAKNHILPFIGEIVIEEITRNELISIIERLKLKNMHSKSVSKLHSYISNTFRHAIAEGICTRNIAEDVKPLLPTNSTVKHRAALRKDQLPEFLKKLEAYGGRYETIIALKLLIWTGTRPQETFAAKWEEFDLDKGLWTIPIHRMKKRRIHTITLQTQAIKALRELNKISGHSFYLFPNQQTPNTHMSENTLNIAIQKGLGFDCTAHGMRSTFSTIMNENGGHRAKVIEVSLAHVDSSVKGIYDRGDYLPERRILMQDWADYLDSLKEIA